MTAFEYILKSLPRVNWAVAKNWLEDFTPESYASLYDYIEDETPWNSNPNIIKEKIQGNEQKDKIVLSFDCNIEDTSQSSVGGTVRGSFLDKFDSTKKYVFDVTFSTGEQVSTHVLSGSSNEYGIHYYDSDFKAHNNGIYEFSLYVHENRMELNFETEVVPTDVTADITSAHVEVKEAN